MERNQRQPVLTAHYRRYLNDADSATFIKAVSEFYLVSTLERIAEYGARDVRRAATLAMGFLADFRSNAVLGRRLNDDDRGVRLLAENAIRDIWCRDGSVHHRHTLHAVIRHVGAGEQGLAIRTATSLIDEAPWFAEVWNQRAIAYFHLGDFRESANDCHQALELNPYHYGAAVGMGHCYLELGDGLAALDCFRRSLRLNPLLDGVRTQIAFLERALEEF